MGGELSRSIHVTAGMAGRGRGGLAAGEAATVARGGRQRAGHRGHLQTESLESHPVTRDLTSQCHDIGRSGKSIDGSESGPPLALSK
eukprot:COSAG04_NODE_1785_length_5585_cov_461.563799_6_plen_87_part_00